MFEYTLVYGYILQGLIMMKVYTLWPARKGINMSGSGVRRSCLPDGGKDVEVGSGGEMGRAGGTSEG